MNETTVPELSGTVKRIFQSLDYCITLGTKANALVCTASYGFV
jgi:hypothetical protein